MNIDEVEKKLIETQTKLTKTTKRLAKFQGKLLIGIVVYALIMYVFITLYQRVGFEYTIIALGVSMITAGLKNMLGF